MFAPGLGTGAALAQAPDAASAEKDAFASAKELGTVEAWNAFLGSYPSGFHADLARAYIKKLSEPTQAATAAPSPAAAPAPAADEFPMVAASWGGIVRSGPGQTFSKTDSLREGQPVTLMGRTDVMENGFPWFKIAYEGDGSGYQWGGILCSTGAERQDMYKTCSASPPPRNDPPAAASRVKPKKAAVGCSSGRIMIDGQCIKKSAAASFCGPGYRAQGGKCVLRSQPAPVARSKCPKGQVWNAQEGCHYDD